jgi:hypothetical protein
MQRESRGKGRTRLFPDPPPVIGEYGLANSLRKHLKVAGVERELLYESTPTNRWIVFHDTRATGAVWRFIHIHRAVDRVRDKGKIKSTKTEHARRVPIEPTLMPLLKAMHREAKGKGRVFPTMPAPSALARRLRVFLKRAGVERDIYTTDKTRRKIDWYGATRGTGITWQAVRGDIDHTKLMARAGHDRFETTLIYIREAENLSADFGEPFPPLPACVLGIAPKSPRAIRKGTKQPKTRGKRVGATGFEPVTSSV